MIPPKQIQKWIDLQSEAFIKNAILEDSKDVQLIRIDEAIPVEFVPRMPSTAMTGEDATTARVCASTTLLGCISSVNKVTLDFYSWRGKGDKFKGGYLISELTSKYHFKPNIDLVKDSDITDEKWLCSIDDNHKSFKPIPLGKFFVYAITTKHSGTKTNTGYSGLKENTVEIFVEVFAGKVMSFNTDVTLGSDDSKENRYYHITYIEKEYDNSNRWRNQLNYNTPLSYISEVNKREYMDAKTLSASNLSIDLSKHISLKW